MRLSPRNVTWENKMKAGFGTEEWGIYILKIWSKYTKTKQFKICQKSQILLTLYVNSVNMKKNNSVF